MSKELLEKVNGLRTTYKEKVAAQKSLLENPELTADDYVKAEEIGKELDKLEGEIKRLNGASSMLDQVKDREDRLVKPLMNANGASLFLSQSGFADLTNTDKHLVIQQVGPGNVGAKEWNAITAGGYVEAHVKYLRVGWHNLSNDEQKLLQEGNDPQGGFLVPEDVLTRLVSRKPAPMRVQNFVSSLNTTRDTVVIPKLNYSSDNIYTTPIRVTWTGEIPASSTTHRATDPSFGQVRVPIYTAMLSMPLSQDLLEDSATDVIALLESKFGETIEILYDDMALNGSGIGQPTGLLTNIDGTDAVASVHSGDASALTGDGLISLAFSLPEQYDENCRFVFNKTSTGLAISQLKDGDGRRLWGQGLQDSGLVPSVRGLDLLGYPTAYSALMPDIAANAYPILYGDFGGYYLIKRIGFSVQVLRELYAETNQVLLIGRLRFGGMPVEPWRLRAQKVAA